MKHKKAGLLCRMSRFIENLACHPLRMIDNAVSGGMGVQVLTLAVVVVAILALFATVIAVYTLIAEGRGDFVGSRLWKMYHVFVDPGNGMEGSGAWTGWKRIGVMCIGITGSIFFGGLLISTISNIIERRVDALKSGQFRYKRIKEHFIILGYDELVPSLIMDLHNDVATSDSPIVLMTGQNVSSVKEMLFSQLDDTVTDKLIIYSGNINSKEDLSGLNFNAAKEVYVFGEEGEIGRDSKNIESLRYINELRDKPLHNTPLVTYVQFSRITSYSSIQKFTLPPEYYIRKEVLYTNASKPNLYYRPFNFYELWSRRLWGLYRDEKTRMSGDYDLLDFVRTDESLSTFASRSSEYYVHLVIVGFNRMGRALLLEALRVCHYANYDDSKTPEQRVKTRITVVDRYMDKLKDTFEAQFPNIGTQIYDIDVDYVNDDINSPVMRKKLVDWSRDKLCKLTVAICVYEPDLGLSMGLSLPPDVYESDARVLIRQEKLNGLGQFIHNDFTGRFKNVKIFGMHAGGIRKKVLDDRLAAYINYSYESSGFIDRHYEKYAKVLSGECRPGDSDYCEFEKEKADAMAAWYRLPENMKWANRYQLDCYPNFCHVFGCGIIHDDAATVETPSVISKDKLEDMMRMEKYRWNAERTIDGWRYSSVRDNSRFCHNLIIPFERMKADAVLSKDIFKDRNVIDNMPKILALGGFKIVTLKAVYEAVTMICDMIDCYSESVCVYKKITELCDMIDFYSEL